MIPTGTVTAAVPDLPNTAKEPPGSSTVSFEAADITKEESPAPGGVSIDVQIKPENFQDRKLYYSNNTTSNPGPKLKRSEELDAIEGDVSQKIESLSVTMEGEVIDHNNGVVVFPDLNQASISSKNNGIYDVEIFQLGDSDKFVLRKLVEGPNMVEGKTKETVVTYDKLLEYGMDSGILARHQDVPAILLGAATLQNQSYGVAMAPGGEEIIIDTESQVSRSYKDKAGKIIGRTIPEAEETFIFYSKPIIKEIINQFKDGDIKVDQLSKNVTVYGEKSQKNGQDNITSVGGDLVYKVVGDNFSDLTVPEGFRKYVSKSYYNKDNEFTIEFQSGLTGKNIRITPAGITVFTANNAVGVTVSPFLQKNGNESCGFASSGKGTVLENIVSIIPGSSINVQRGVYGIDIKPAQDGFTVDHNTPTYSPGAIWKDMARFQEEKVTHADMNKEVGSKYGQGIKIAPRSEGGGNLPMPPRE